MAQSPNPSPGSRPELVPEVKSPIAPRPPGPPGSEECSVLKGPRLAERLLGQLVSPSSSAPGHSPSKCKENLGAQGEDRHHLWHEKPLTSLSWFQSNSIPLSRFTLDALLPLVLATVGSIPQKQHSQSPQAGQAAPQPNPSTTRGLGCEHPRAFTAFRVVSRGEQWVTC